MRPRHLSSSAFRVKPVNSGGNRPFSCGHNQCCYFISTLKLTSGILTKQKTEQWTDKCGWADLTVSLFVTALRTRVSRGSRLSSRCTWRCWCRPRAGGRGHSRCPSCGSAVQWTQDMVTTHLTRPITWNRPFTGSTRGLH